MSDDDLIARRDPISRFPAICVLWRLGLAVVLVTLIAATEVVAQEGSSLVGASRGDVIRSFGEPENTLRKGNVDLLIYPNGVRIEIKDNVVIGYRGSVGSGMLSRGGTDYAAGEDGNVQKAKPAEIQLVQPPAEPEAEVASGPAVNAEVPEETSNEESSVEDVEAKENEPVHEEEMDPDHLYDEAGAQAEEYLENFGVVEEPEAPSPAATAMQTTIQLIGRFVFALLILRLTLGWLGRPFYFPDLIKISLLNTAIQTGLHGLGNLGGNWEFITIFKVPDIVSFFALAILLFKFGVTRDGLTALKIAGATIVVTYFLMIGLGIVLVFGLGAAI